jgi:hypothetical protein
MQEQLLGYLLGALEPAEHEAIERQLNERRELQLDLEKLRCCLDPLHCDAGHVDPPPALASRTCAIVARQAAPPPTRVLRPVSTITAGAGGGFGARWSLMDLAVAAGIIITATLLFFPAMNRSRAMARTAVCQNNIKEIAYGVRQYSDLHNGYLPFVPIEGKLALGGAYASILHDAGFVPDDRKFLCPSCKLSDDPHFRIPTQRELETATGEELAQLRKYAGGSFGFGLGHLEGDRYVGTHDESRPTFAILADNPCPEDPDRHSRNHGGCGQNVLFEDGHVVYLDRCLPDGSDDHIFKNADGLVAPGVHANDSVIVPGQLPTNRLPLPASR